MCVCVCVCVFTASRQAEASGPVTANKSSSLGSFYHLPSYLRLHDVLKATHANYKVPPLLSLCAPAQGPHGGSMVYFGASRSSPSCPQSPRNSRLAPPCPAPSACWRWTPSRCPPRPIGSTLGGRSVALVLPVQFRPVCPFPAASLRLGGQVLLRQELWLLSHLGRGVASVCVHGQSLPLDLVLT